MRYWRPKPLLRKFKYFIYRYYWLIALILFVVFCIFRPCLSGADKTGYFVSVVGFLFGFCYFVQRQKLAEASFFNQLFTQFNNRYDKLNDGLARLWESGLPENGLIPYPEQRNLIVDYFNLCAEEFLFYEQGYILDDAWQSWCRGMKWYLDQPLFRGVWDDEIKTGSFYGLNLDKIIEGAA